MGKQQGNEKGQLQQGEDGEYKAVWWKLGSQNRERQRGSQGHERFLYEIRVTVVGYVLNHDPAVTETGQRVQLNKYILNHPDTSHRNRCIIQQCVLYCNSYHNTS